MAVSAPYNRVRVATSTTGTGTVTLSSAETGYCSFADAGVPNAATVTYLIEDGNDFEIGQGVYTSSGTTMTRATVYLSKISGTAGTSKINLSGSAKVSLTEAAEDINSKSPIGKQTIWVPAAAMYARTTNGAASGSVETGSNLVMLKTLDFDTSTQEFAQFMVAMPKGWNESTVTFQPVWSHPSTSTNFGVVWSLQGLARSDDDAGDTAFGTEQTSTDTGGTTNNIYIGPESSAITVGGTPAENDVVFFQVKRVPSNGSDTLAVDARLHGVKLYYTTDAATDA